MKVTVVLCTFNRSQILGQALESIARSEMPESTDWEILVVDNNSNDRTPEVVEEFSGRYPGRFRYLFEPHQGKSFALNTGIRDARGEILAFTDDDIVVAPTWLRNLISSLESGEWDSSGGRIEAGNNFTCPPWLALQGEFNLGGVLGFFDLGDKPCAAKEPFFGGNVAYRRGVFEKHGLYRTDLGRSGGSLLSSEDIELSRRVMASGKGLWYEPSAVVYHAVPKNRLTQDYFLKYFFHYGRSCIRETANPADVYGIPRWCFSVPILIKNMLVPRVRKWLSTHDTRGRFYFKCLVWWTLGEIVELPHLWIQRKQRRKSTSMTTALQAGLPHQAQISD